jgi:membrane-bound metal-dependent hydrolase YbcI (DUF457 family)
VADWITHVCVAYAVFTTAGWQLGWLENRWIGIGVVGAILPDLSRIRLLVDSEQVSSLVGIPFEWGGIHSLGGIVLLSGIGALLFHTRENQIRAFVLLFAGALSHLLVDFPQPYADGKSLAGQYLFPFPVERFSVPRLYVSSDRWVAAIAVSVAILIFLVDRYWIPDGAS